MKARFYLVIILLGILFAGWILVSYEQALSRQQQLEELTHLPVFAYVADTTKVAPLMKQIQGLPAIKSIAHETGMQAATELIQAYGLPLNERSIEDYSFPDLITVNFAASPEALKTRDIVLDILRAAIPAADIDSQSGAFGKIAAQLDTIHRRELHFHIFAAVLLLLIFVFIRLSVELHLLIHYKGKKHSVVDKLRHQRMGVQHTWTMLLIPLPLCVGSYFLLVYLLPLRQLLPWWTFVTMAAAALIGTLINHFMLHTFEQEIAFDENPIKVVSSIPEPPIKEGEDA